MEESNILKQDAMHEYCLNKKYENPEVILGGCSVINIKTKDKSYFLHYSSGEVDDYLINGKPSSIKIELKTVTETGNGFLKSKHFSEYKPKTESKLRKDIENLIKKA